MIQPGGLTMGSFLIYNSRSDNLIKLNLPAYAYTDTAYIIAKVVLAVVLISSYRFVIENFTLKDFWIFNFSASPGKLH